jgi:hypothetical protein
VTEPPSTAPAGGRTDAEVAALLDELEASRKEVLRLRDLAIGREAELGTARGRITELTAELARYAHLESRLNAVLESRSWRIAQAFGAPLRAVRRRKA